MSEETRPFEWMELKAMCLLCATETALMVASIENFGFKDEIEARKHVEAFCEETINLRWNHPSKLEKK